MFLCSLGVKSWQTLRNVQEDQEYVLRVLSILIQACDELCKHCQFYGHVNSIKLSLFADFQVETQ